MPLHPQLESLRRQRIAAGRRPLSELTVAEARAAELAEPQRDADTPEVAEVVERSIPGPAGAIPIRVYVPEHTRPLPVLVYFFGGGWVLGGIDTTDAVCRRLATATPCGVVSIGYRLAPEHRFPAAVDDCWAGALWLGDHADELGLDPARFAVGGASAGANLAAVVAHLARDADGPSLAFQLLVYPPTDYRADTRSLRESTDRYFFNREAIAWCWSHYLARERDGDDPRASPLRASDFRDLPPALVITAELDPLRDEGELYAERLAAAGVPTELVRYDGMVHGFFSMTDLVEAARGAQTRAVAALRRAFAP